ncbi:putative entry exclusion protein TrbK-alt [Mesorhizobium sp. J8]|uniref:putative entry exclusion protein TrbK-alt n=1 Tax=Mesorhizobium sp. J8 TaxID=2777475 RepID=UPI00191584C4|nr:putative entry exclusion protein TrbK-alt [Mesorhizobium sp. J8]BCM21041.1 hypothetical protein MJ8_48320 [Mesorhizobium sp. J8]
MDGKNLVRILAVVFVAAAVTATALEMSRKDHRTVGEGSLTGTPSVPNPLRDGLHRCQILGEAALREEGCTRLWAEQRERFLGLEKPPRDSTIEPAASRSPDPALHEVR